MSEHDHAPGEHHGHSHDAASQRFGSAFALGVALQTTFVVVEAVVGLMIHSLAVLADAGHNVSDVLSLLLAWGAHRLGQRRATRGRTYGLKSASILAAVVNSVTLVFVNGAVAWEAVGRLRSTDAVSALPMIVVSVVGVAVNGFSAWLFSKDSEGDLNIRAAFLHLASDAAVSAGVALTGVAIYFTGLRWLDPAASLVVAAVVLGSTWSLLRRALDLALHAVPRGIDESAVLQWLAALPNVKGVHDLHVWAMSTTENVLSAHLVVHEMPTDASACVIDAGLRKKFPIHHVTIQMEPEGSGCSLKHVDAI